MPTWSPSSRLPRPAIRHRPSFAALPRTMRQRVYRSVDMTEFLGSKSQVQITEFLLQFLGFLIAEFHIDTLLQILGPFLRDLNQVGHNPPHLGHVETAESPP